MPPPLPGCPATAEGAHSARGWLDQDDDGLVVEYIDDVLPAVDAQDDPGIPGVGNEPAAKPTGVEVDHANVLQETRFDDGLGQQDTTLTQETTLIQAMPVPADSALPCQGMTTQNARVRKPPEKYIPSMKGKKYAIAMTQIAESLRAAKCNGIGPDVC